MRIYSSLPESVDRLTAGAIAIGNFDGVHLGHQALFAEVRRTGKRPCALTFDPHPARLLAPAYAPPLICERSRKLELIEGQGVTDLVEQTFDKAFMATDAGAFEQLLVRTGVSDVVVGHD